MSWESEPGSPRTSESSSSATGTEDLSAVQTPTPVTRFMITGRVSFHASATAAMISYYGWFLLLFALFGFRFWVGREFEEFVSSDFCRSGGTGGEGIREGLLKSERVFVAVAKSDENDELAFFCPAEIEDAAFWLVGFPDFGFVVPPFVPAGDDGDDEAEDSEDGNGQGERQKYWTRHGYFLVVGGLNEVCDGGSK